RANLPGCLGDSCHACAARTRVRQPAPTYSDRSLRAHPRQARTKIGKADSSPPRVLIEARLSALLGDIRSSDSILVPLRGSVDQVQTQHPERLRTVCPASGGEITSRGCRSRPTED